ncbi:MAG: lipoprotein signal peptidase [Bacteroidales bacterium]|nr:lipoprotein signal peptidase [Bacteroidales bacterium]
MKKAVIVVFLVLLLDQILKFWIKTTMYLGEDIHVFGDWFIIHFTENNGMAFGWEFAGKSGKYLLSIFRFLAVIGIGYYIWYANKKKARPGLLIALGLIFAGALGNIIDSAFYGMIFSESGNYFNQIPAVLFPESGGYSSFLQGKVVDMFYFPIIKGSFPEWLMGGRDFIFFRPVFNFADTSITVGVLMLLIFQKRYFTSHGHGIRPVNDRGNSKESESTEEVDEM